MSINNIAHQNQSILIVDDDASIRMTAAGILELQGYSILEAENAEVCLSICQKQKPDLILLDAVMPGIDGFSCALKLKSFLGIQCPPIVMMTALDDRDSIYRSFDVGITDYLVKPIDWISLPDKIKKLAFNHSKSIKLKEQFEEMNLMKEKLNDIVHAHMIKNQGKIHKSLCLNLPRI